MTEEQRKNNYTMFIIGVALLAVGTAVNNTALFTIGIVFFIVGLAQANRNPRRPSIPESISPDAAFKLTDKDNQELIGVITGKQLQFLIDALEEEFLEDRDYAITPMTIAYLKEKGADPSLSALLELAVGERDEATILWSRSD